MYYDNGVDQETVELFKCVLPEVPSQSDYLALMYILKDDISFRAVAAIIGELKHTDYTFMLTDVYLAASADYEPEIELIERLRRNLERCGYDKWLKDNQ